jgi:hypothetical protein
LKVNFLFFFKKFFISLESEQDETNSQQDNGTNGTANVQLTEKDKEKGNLKKFNISKKTIKKLKGKKKFFKTK